MAKGVINARNEEIAWVLFSILKSVEGKRVFIEHIQKETDFLEQNLDGFIKMMEGKGYFKILTDPDFNETSVRKQVAEIKDKLNGIGNQDVERLIALIRENYIIAGHLTTEGFLVGVHEFLISYMQDYVKMINLKAGFDIEMAKENYIMSILSADVIVDAKRLQQFFPDISGLKNGKDVKDLDKKAKISSYNIQLLRKQMVIDDNLIKRLVGYNPNNKKSVEKYEDIKEMLKRKEQEALFDKNDSIEGLNDSLFNVVEQLVYKMAEIRKNIYSKNIRKHLERQFAI